MHVKYEDLPHNGATCHYCGKKVSPRQDYVSTFNGGEKLLVFCDSKCHSEWYKKEYDVVVIYPDDDVNI